MMIRRGNRFNRSIQERLWSRVSKDPDSGCWNWNGHLTKAGYGQIGTSIPKKSLLLTHRLAWTIYNGEIPDGMCVCHKCDNPRCCNPEHLFVGTHAENMKDCHRKKRSVHFTKPDCFPRGEESYLAKITKSQAVDVLDMCKQGVVARIIADKHKITISAVYKIKHGKSWKKELSTTMSS